MLLLDFGLPFNGFFFEIDVLETVGLDTHCDTLLNEQFFMLDGGRNISGFFHRNLFLDIVFGLYLCAFWSINICIIPQCGPAFLTKAQFGATNGRFWAPNGGNLLLFVGIIHPQQASLLVDLQKVLWQV